MHEIEHGDGAREIIGIDLGTSEVRVARLNLAGAPEIINNAEGNHVTPAAVLIEDSGAVVIGTEAKKLAGLGHHNAFADFKREMGSGHSWRVNGRCITPEELSGYLLKKVVSDFVQQFGQPQSIAITWPANFRQEQRGATKAAARHAGLHNVCFVEESVAAALGYAHRAGLRGYYLIYDFGGGTFNVTLLEANEDSITVLNQTGVQRLGGKDLDCALLKLIDEKFRVKTGEGFDRFDCHFSDHDLENARQTLSVRPSLSLRLRSFKHGMILVEVTREEYESSISHLIIQAELACESVLCLPKEAEYPHIKASDIAEIFMVGETCLTPAIQASVFRMFGKKPVIRNPSEAVAMGATLLAALRADPEKMSALQRQSIVNIVAEPVAPYYFGTTIMDHESGQPRNEVVICKGEKLPRRVTRTYFTARDRQASVICDMTQSSNNESDPDFVCKVIERSLKLPPDTPKGTPITVTFECDIEGCASLMLSGPPENDGGSTAAGAKINPPTKPPLTDER